MTLTVDITPQSQAELARQAAAEGIGVELYAAHLLEQAAHAPEERGSQTEPPRNELPAFTEEPYDPQPLETTLHEMAQFFHKIPSLPDEAFSRESFYREHD
jgi:hypothetical protein